MNLLDHLYPGLTLRTNPHSLPVSEEDMGSLLSVFPSAAPEYVEMIRQHDRFEVLNEESAPYFYISVFSALDALYSMTKWYPWMIQMMPGCFFFGRDGDLVFFISGDERRPGVFRVECSWTDWKDAEYVAPSLHALFCEGLNELHGT